MKKQQPKAKQEAKSEQQDVQKGARQQQATESKKYTA